MVFIFTTKPYNEFVVVDFELPTEMICSSRSISLISPYTVLICLLSGNCIRTSLSDFVPAASA